MKSAQAGANNWRRKRKTCVIRGKRRRYGNHLISREVRCPWSYTAIQRRPIQSDSSHSFAFFALIPGVVLCSPARFAGNTDAGVELGAEVDFLDFSSF